MPVLRAVRTDRGLSQRAAAAKCGISQGHLSLIESGKVTPSIVVFQRICAGLELSDKDRLAALNEMGGEPESAPDSQAA